MTANHEHTPTTPEYVKDPAHFRAVYVDHMDSGKYDGPTPNASERTRGAYALQFDRMIRAVEAAAEQRGAARALRDAAGAIEKNNIVFDGDHYQPCNSCMSIHMNWLDYRADQMEGDDE